MSNRREVIELSAPSRRGAEKFVSRVQDCGYCHGAGSFAAMSRDDRRTVCPDCGGSGKVRAVVRVDWVPVVREERSDDMQENLQIPANIGNIPSEVSIASDELVIGRRIKEVRKYFRLTQEKFAHRLGIRQSFYSALEAGKRRISIKQISRLCEMGVSITWLFYGSGEMFDVNKSEEYPGIL